MVDSGIKQRAEPHVVPVYTAYASVREKYATESPRSNFKMALVKVLRARRMDGPKAAKMLGGCDMIFSYHTILHLANVCVCFTVEDNQ